MGAWNLTGRPSAFSFSLVAAIRVMDISSGMTGSQERAKAICRGPRTWPQLMRVVMTAPNVRTTKKQMNLVSRLAAASL